LESGTWDLEFGTWNLGLGIWELRTADCGLRTEDYKSSVKQQRFTDGFSIFVYMKKKKNLSGTFRTLAVLCSVVMCFSGARAQWNMNTFVNLEIAAVSNADMQTVSTSDSKTWVAFFSQNSGNYDMRAQLLDASGNKLLGTNGMLVSNQPSGTATYVFNVCVDASNNLIIGCQDQRSGPMQAVMYKVSQSGSHLWSSSGVILGEGLAPYPAVLTTGEVVVAWNESVSNTLNLQKISTSGTALWTPPIQLLVGTTGTTRGQVIANTGGKFTVVYQKKGVGISTTLYAQMFNNSGTALYTPLQICNQTTSGARYYSVAADNDVTFVGYYSSSGSRFNSFLQRIEAAGTIPWGMNGSNFNTATAPSDNYQGQTDINLAPGSGYVWSLCTFSNPNQTQYGVYIQKFDKTSGARQLTDLGKVVYAISTSRDEHAGKLALINDTPMFMSYDDVYKIYATRLDANGNFSWPVNRVEISSTTASMAVPKMRYGFTPDGPNRCAGVWTEDRGGGYLGYAQGISIGGLLGIHVATQGNVPAVITTPGGTLQMVDTIFPTTASQNSTWSIVQGTGNASITPSGLVTAMADGTVWARSVAVQDPTVRDSVLITISGQIPMPPTVITQAATNVTTSSAQLHGSVNANNSSTTVSFNWGLTTAYGNTIAGVPGTVTGSSPVAVLANLSGLLADTTYHFRCVGVNSLGTTYGADLTFYTGCLAPAGPGPITGPVTVCQGQTGVSYSIAPIPNATGYNWTVPSGGTITSGSGTPSILVNFSSGASSGNVTVAGTNVCGAGPAGTLAVAVDQLPGAAGPITGTSAVCGGTTGVAYSVASIANTVTYVWSFPAGASITSGAGTNNITVDFASNASSGDITVYGNNLCGNGVPSPPFPVLVTALPEPAGTINGPTGVCQGTTGIVYAVNPIPNATSYEWSVPTGASISGPSNTNSITVDFSPTASSGPITVYGTNSCGDGPVSPQLNVTVSPPPATPVITLNWSTLSSDAPTGNQWFREGTAVPGATGQSFVPTEIGWYWDVVTINGCSSDTSNHIYVLVTGVDNSMAPLNIRVSPVPNDGKFTVVIQSPEEEVFSISVINFLGKRIYDSGELTGTGTFEQQVDIRTAAPGIYAVEVLNGSTRVVRKILVQE